MKIANRLGFTLIEAMMTVVIFAVMLGGVYGSLQVGTRAWSNLSANLLTRQEIRRGLVVISKDLRQASELLVEKDNAHVLVNFKTEHDGLVSYSWTNQGQNANKIIRKNYEKSRTLASGISLFEVNMPNSQEAMVTLSAGGPDRPVSIKEKIAFRMKTNPFNAVNP
jgi:prepilin-type N-terminal cleavage/methylation domain-containing protein